MKKLLSTSQIAILALLAIGLSACVDSVARFEAFDERIPDAAPPVPEPDAEILLNIPDISGTFLFALAAVIAPDPPFQFIADIQINGNTLDISLTGLDRYDRSVVPGDFLGATDVPIDETGRFEVPIVGVIPGDANVVSGSDLTVDLVLIGRIRDENTFCGDATGMILKPLELDIVGSTIGGIRIESGISGDDLPAPLVACPTE